MFTNKPTIVSCDTVVDRAQVLVEFTDGTFKVYPFPLTMPQWAQPNLRHMTHDQIVARLGELKRAYDPVPLPRSYVTPSIIAGAAYWRRPS